MIEDVRRKYACECTIRTADKPAQPVEKSAASASLLMHVAQWADLQPLHRQEKMFARRGVTISRQIRWRQRVTPGRAGAFWVPRGLRRYSSAKSSLAPEAPWCEKEDAILAGTIRAASEDLPVVVDRASMAETHTQPRIDQRINIVHLTVAVQKAA